MNEDELPLGALFLNFAIFSVFAIGGVNAAIPEMHRQAVAVHGWMSDRRFADLFAIAQAAPGPNAIIATLIGWDVAGLAGVLVATFAMIGPTSLLAYLVGGLWHRFRHARWRIAIQAGVTPMTVGLVASSAYLLARAGDKSVAAVAITLATGAAVYFTRIHPLAFLAIGAALGAAGLV